MTSKDTNAKRLTYINNGKYSSIINDEVINEKLGELEDIEEELGVDLITLFKALKKGIIYTEYGYIQQCYICFVDDEWIIVNLKNDDWWLLKDYGKTWALTKEELENEIHN